MSGRSRADASNAEAWRLKKKANAEIKLKHYLNEVQKMINTPSFLYNYFRTREG
jgi:hypothetical protein